MRRKMLLASILLTSGLAITGCGSNADNGEGGPSGASDKETPGNQEGSQPEALSSELAPEITEKRPKPKEAQLNQPIPVYSNGKVVPGAEATIDTLSAGHKCEFGFDDHGDSNVGKLQEDQKLVQVKATFDVKAVPGQGNEPVLLDDPTIVDDAGKSRQIISSSYCMVDGSGYQDWIMGAEPGKVTKLYGSWIVPANTKGIVIAGQAFGVD